MKKNQPKDHEKKPRRLILSRETVRVLQDPASLELVRGGVGTSSQPHQPSCGPDDTSTDAC